MLVRVPVKQPWKMRVNKTEYMFCDELYMPNENFEKQFIKAYNLYQSI